MSTLLVIRHGQSQWNLENRFTGWVDIPLSSHGRKEAIHAGKKIANIVFDVGYTSVLIRAIETLLLVCAQTKSGKIPVFVHSAGKQKQWEHHTGNPCQEIPIIMHEALNERYYGTLQGLNKDAARKKWGKEQVHLWRRSFTIAPPKGESLQKTSERTLPYFKNHILNHCKKGKNVLIVAHGNSLRAIVKYLENINDSHIPLLEIPTGVPWLYHINTKGHITEKKILL